MRNVGPTWLPGGSRCSLFGGWSSTQAWTARLYLTFDMDGDGPEPTRRRVHGTVPPTPTPTPAPTPTPHPDPHADPDPDTGPDAHPGPDADAHAGPAATTTRSRAGPRRTPSPAQPGLCIPTDAQVGAAVGQPFAIWATIDVTTASDSEVRFGLVCTGVSGSVGYGTPVTLNAPPHHDRRLAAPRGRHPGGHPVTVNGYVMRQRRARPGCPAARAAACSAAGRRPRPGPPACTSPSTWTATAPSPPTSCTRDRPADAHADARRPTPTPTPTPTPHPDPDTGPDAHPGPDADAHAAPCSYDYTIPGGTKTYAVAPPSRACASRPTPRSRRWVGRSRSGPRSTSRPPPTTRCGSASTAPASRAASATGRLVASAARRPRASAGSASRAHPRRAPRSPSTATSCAASAPPGCPAAPAAACSALVATQAWTARLFMTFDMDSDGPERHRRRVHGRRLIPVPSRP